VAFDEDLAARVRKLVGRQRGATESGCSAAWRYLLDGNMAVFVRGKCGLTVRVDPADYETVQAEPGASPARMRGRPMRGRITVTESGCAKDTDLRRWVTRGMNAARNAPKT
jgi:hypothetical protein